MSFSIETIKEYTGAGFKCALFDFDGTISLIREGWQKVMVPYFCEVIEALGTGESEDGIREEVTEFVDRLTGKQTIFQCIALAEASQTACSPKVHTGDSAITGYETIVFFDAIRKVFVLLLRFRSFCIIEK